MKVPLRWLAEYVDYDLSPEELARVLTFAGLEVEAMAYVGKPLPSDPTRAEAKITGLEWDRERIVVGAVTEVLPHPDADRLVLIEVDDGQGTHTAVTGAPNLYSYRGRGPLDPPLKIAYAKQGARLFDGHKSGLEVKKLKRSKIRGIESSSMACSEKELGISDEHEGVILFDEDAPQPGTPLQDYIGDVVLDVAITPNMSRNANILGVAREVAALTGGELRKPDLSVTAAGPPVAEKIRIDIRQPELNPRFTATMIEGIEIGPSPYWLQLRLRLAGMRPINNVVDVTNYVMLEIGQPLHAFDYDVLAERARSSGSDLPTVITRVPEAGERLETLDGVDRELDDFTVLVSDTAGVLSLGGIMGGAESEVSDSTTNVLLEAAAWNLINIRRTVQAQQLQTSQAGYRFSRGVHPEQARRGNLRAIELMRRLAGGTIREGMVDEYPMPPEPAVVVFPLSELRRYLGDQVDIPMSEVVRILKALEFGIKARTHVLTVTAPDHRLDVGSGAVGIADLIEEIARIWGYERIPETQITDTIPPQRGNPLLEREEEVRDLLVELGLQEVITYRLTSPERERRALAPGAPEDDRSYVTLANPIVVDRVVMRHSLLPSVLEVAETNARIRERLALFEIGKVFWPVEGEELPDEPVRLAIVLSGPREDESWTGGDSAAMDFFDLKGMIEELVAALHLSAVRYDKTEHPGFHPNRAASLVVGEREIGVFGELHPQVQAEFGLEPGPVLAADLDLEALLGDSVDNYPARPVSRYPAIVEDLALIVDDATPAADLETVIAEAGGPRLVEIRLFDLFRGDQVGAGKKSLAYRLAYQSSEGTLTDRDAAKLRKKILKNLERKTGAVLRG
ncbi:MAG: phenylalanine--tRNA ligase subunit beta [Thermoanaerobaculia bacterium]